MPDHAQRRWLIIEGDSIVETLSYLSPSIVATRGIVVSATSNGTLLSRGATSLEQTREAQDSVPLVFVQMGSTSLDTVARLSIGDTRTETRFDGGERPSGITFITPILDVPEQALLFEDGWLAVARVDPYRIDWRRPDGNWIRGPLLPHGSIPLNAREQDAHRRRLSLLGRREPPPIALWAATVPPFLDPFPSSPLIAMPTGELLVGRVPTADAFESRYDVVARDGRLLAQVVMPVNERIVSVGRRGLYSVITTDMGLEFVRRHPVPRFR